MGIDLASAAWSSVGSALLHVDPATRAFTRVLPGIAVWPATPLTPQALADAIHTLAVHERVCAVAIDGPHAWRDPETPANAPGVGRRAEYLLRAQCKTGVYPRTYPGTQASWTRFSIAVFDALLARAGVTLAMPAAAGLASALAAAPARASEPPPAPAPHGGYALLESFPTAIWRAAALTPLPAKARRPDLARFYAALAAAFGLPPAQVSSHDDLQAVVAALAGAGLAGGPVLARAHGVPGRVVAHAAGRQRVEGFIWDATPAPTL